MLNLFEEKDVDFEKKDGHFIKAACAFLIN